MTFKEVYGKHFAKLVTYWKHTGKCREADAEDIVQDSFNQLYKDWDKMQSYDENVLLKWLYKCMPFKNLEYLRSIDINTVPLDDKGVQLQLYTRIIEDLSIPDGVEENRKWNSYMEQIKKDLTSEQKTLFAYRVEQQLPFAEIAKRLDTTEDAAKMRWYRLRKRLYPIVRRIIQENM